MRPKVDFNILLAGLGVNRSRNEKEIKKAETGVFKGLYVCETETPYGKAYICNGAEFPTSTTVELLLYFVWELEKRGWVEELEFPSVRSVLLSLGKHYDGRTLRQFKRDLVILKNHQYYFDSSFKDSATGETKTLYFGIVESVEWRERGEGFRIRFNPVFVSVLKNSQWYRRVPLEDFLKLKSSVAKALYLKLLYHKSGNSWEVYLPKDLRPWYRRVTNSFAKDDSLKPSRLRSLIEKALEEINAKTHLKCTLESWEKIRVVDTLPPEETPLFKENQERKEDKKEQERPQKSPATRPKKVERRNTAFKTTVETIKQKTKGRNDMIPKDHITNEKQELLSLIHSNRNIARSILFRPYTEVRKEGEVFYVSISDPMTKKAFERFVAPSVDPSRVKLV